MRIGTQARSFGAGIYKDEGQFLSVLSDAGVLGFEGIESNWKNLEPYFEKPDVFRGLLEKNGLTLIGAHYGGALANSAELPGMAVDIRRIAAFVSAVSGELIVFSCRAPEKDTAEAWALISERLNDMGRICRDNGVMLSCHNHWWEPAGVGFETLVRGTDPELVGIAFDTGHYTRAGRDAAAAIIEFADRIPLIHLADWDGEDRPCLGDGNLDVAAVRAALAETGYKGWIALEENTEFGNAIDHVGAALKMARQVAGRA